MSPKEMLSRFIFFSRWYQAPLYLGLIIVLVLYVYEFGIGLLNLALNVKTHQDSAMMLQALDLIDVVMIANLLIMVIVGGYQTFVSNLNFKNHPDHPEWLDEMNAGTMKVKLALALVGISSIHLLRTFIDTASMTNSAIMWQVLIHLTLIVSAIAIAITNKLMSKPGAAH